ncbi:hypothetical protein [Thalassotalea sp. PLHSN55]|uniref:hypothetical protein n=1 Tax=Thalassotalea sp. PLHSN55 TaxID=3435888 RepID=UPI003F857433
MKYLVTYIFTFLLATYATANTLPSLLLGSYNSPPYVQVEDNSIQGISINTIECIFNQLDMEVAFAIYPLKRALVELDKNTIDGVFPVNFAESQKSTRTLPVSIKKWFWLSNYKLTDSTEISDKKHIGAVRGSPEHFWLLANNYSVNTLVTTQKQLLEMFKAGRVDIIIVDKNLTNESLEFQDILNATNNYWLFLKYESQHLAFSDNVLTQHANLIHHFNQSISACAPLSLRLTNDEKIMLKDYSQSYLTKVVDYLRLHPAQSLLQNEITQSYSEKIDNQWRSEVSNGAGDLYELIMNSEFSKFLFEQQLSANQTITEILAIDTDGYAIAMSQATTDLYQGDEPKFINTHGIDKVHVSDIVFDQSTKTYQSQISFSLPKSMYPISVLTFGVDIKKIYQQKN